MNFIVVERCYANKVALPIDYFVVESFNILVYKMTKITTNVHQRNTKVAQFMCINAK